MDCKQSTESSSHDTLRSVAKNVVRAIKESPRQKGHAISLCHHEGNVDSFTVLQTDKTEGEEFSSTGRTLLIRAILIALATIIHFLGTGPQSAMSRYQLLEGLVLYINTVLQKQKNLNESYSRMTDAILQGLPLADTLSLPTSLRERRIAVIDTVRKYLIVPASQLTLSNVAKLLVQLAAYSGQLSVSPLPDEATDEDIVFCLLKIILNISTGNRNWVATYKQLELGSNCQENLTEELLHCCDTVKALAKENEQLQRQLDITQEYYKERESIYDKRISMLYEQDEDTESFLQWQGIQCRELVREQQRQIEKLKAELEEVKELQHPLKQDTTPFTKTHEQAQGGGAGTKPTRKMPKAKKETTLEAIADQLTPQSTPEEVATAILNTLSDSKGIVMGGSKIAMSWEVMTGVSFAYLKLR